MRSIDVKKKLKNNEITGFFNSIPSLKTPIFTVHGKHYLDFIVKMKSGRIFLVESKGDDRDNSKSKTKLKMGKQWA